MPQEAFQIRPASELPRGVTLLTLGLEGFRQLAENLKVSEEALATFIDSTEKAILRWLHVSIESSDRVLPAENILKSSQATARAFLSAPQSAQILFLSLLSPAIGRYPIERARVAAREVEKILASVTPSPKQGHPLKDVALRGGLQYLVPDATVIGRASAVAADDLIDGWIKLRPEDKITASKVRVDFGKVISSITVTSPFERVFNDGNTEGILEGSAIIRETGERTVLKHFEIEMLTSQLSRAVARIKDTRKSQAQS